MNEEILKNIWNQLTADGMTTSDFETWKNNFAGSEEIQQNIHTYLFENGMTKNDLETWSSNVGLKKKDNTQQQPKKELIPQEDSPKPFVMPEVFGEPMPQDYFIYGEKTPRQEIDNFIETREPTEQQEAYEFQQNVGAGTGLGINVIQQPKVFSKPEFKVDEEVLSKITLDPNIQKALEKNLITEEDIKKAFVDGDEVMLKKIQSVTRRTPKEIRDAYTNKRLNEVYTYEKSSGLDDNLNQVKMNLDEISIDEMYGIEKLKKIDGPKGKINIKDFDGYLSEQGYKKQFKKYLEDETISLDGREYDISGNFNPSLAAERLLFTYLNNYLNNQVERNVDFQKLQYQEENDGSMPSLDGVELSYSSGVDTEKVKEFIQENFPRYVQKLKAQDAKNQELWQERKKDTIWNWDVAGDLFVDSVTQGARALNDRIDTLSEGFYNFIGMDGAADEIRMNSAETKLNRADLMRYVLANGKEVEVDGVKYLVDDTGQVYSTAHKLRVTHVLSPGEYKAITQAAKREGKDTYSFSGIGLTVETTGVLSDMLLQLAVQRNASTLLKGSALMASNIGGGVKKTGDLLARIPIKRDMSGIIIGQGTLFSTNLYAETKTRALEQGLSVEKADEISAMAAKQGFTLGALTAPLSPQMYAMNKIFGKEATKKISKEMLDAYVSKGPQGFQEVAKKYLGKVLFYNKQGLAEMFQENVQQGGEAFVVAPNINKVAGKEIIRDTISLQEFLNTSILSYAAGFLMPFGGDVFSKATGRGGGVDGTDKLQLLSILAEDVDKTTELLNSQVAKGLYTEQQVNKILSDIEVYRNSINSIPTNLSSQTGLEVMQDLNEINRLEQKKKKLDKAFHAEIDNEIEGIRENIRKKVDANKQVDSEVEPELEQTPQAITDEQVIERITTEKDSDVYTQEEFDNMKKKMEQEQRESRVSKDFDALRRLKDEKGEDYADNLYKSNPDQFFQEVEEMKKKMEQEQTESDVDTEVTEEAETKIFEEGETDIEFTRKSQKGDVFTYKQVVTDETVEGDEQTTGVKKVEYVGQKNNSGRKIKKATVPVGETEFSDREQELREQLIEDGLIDEDVDVDLDIQEARIIPETTKAAGSGTISFKVRVKPKGKSAFGAPTFVLQLPIKSGGVEPEVQQPKVVNESNVVMQALNEAENKITKRAQGRKALQDAKKAVIKFLKESLPSDVYSKPEVLKITRKVQRATENNIDKIFKEIQQVVNQKVNVKLEKQINNILTDKYQKTEGGKVKAKGIDNEMRKRIASINSRRLKPGVDVGVVFNTNKELLERINELDAKTVKTDSDLNEMVDLTILLNLNNSLLMENNDINKTKALSNAATPLEQMIEEGRSELKEELTQASKKYAGAIGIVFRQITGKKIDFSDPQAKQELRLELKDVKDLKKRKEQTQNVIKKFFTTINTNIKAFFNQAEALDGLMDLISKTPGDMFGGILQEMVTARVDESSIIFKERTIQNELTLANFFEKLYGKKWRSEVRKNNNLPNEPTYIRNEKAYNQAYKDYESNPTKENKAKLDKAKDLNLKFLSQNQIIYVYNLAKDPANDAAFEKTFGPDYKRILNEIENKLDPKAKQFADWLVNDFYPSLYNHYNKTYKALYRTDMPYNEFYSGMIYRENIEREPPDMLGNPFSINNSVGSSSTKARTDTNAEIKIMNAVDVMATYLRDMEYFAAYGETIRDINKMFSEPAVKDAISNIHGDYVNKLIDNMIGKIANKGVRTNVADSFINTLNNFFLVGRIGANPTITLKQLTSMITYANDIGYVNWLKHGLTNIPKIRKTWKEISENSTYMTDRNRVSITRIIEAYSDKKMVKFVGGRHYDNFVNFVMYPTKFGDRAAIFLGGMPNYIYYKKQALKEGKTEKEAIKIAIKKFERDTKRTQQSQDLQDKDYFQTGSAWVRGMNMFLTTPKQYLRKEIQGARNLYRKAKAWDSKAGKGNLTENLRTLVTYHVFAPVLFQYVALGLPGILRGFRDDDDEDLIRAALIGNLNALFIMGELINNLADKVQGKPYAGKNFRNIAPLMVTSRVWQLYDRWEKTKDPIKKQEALERLLAEVASIPGIPAIQIQKFVKNMENLGKDGDVGKDILRLLNYSEYQIEGPDQDAPKKRKPMSKTDMKRLLPDLYEDLYGKGGALEDLEKEKKALRKETREATK